MIRFSNFLIALLLSLIATTGYSQTAADSGKDLHLVYVGPALTPQYKWFFTNPDLANLREKCNWTHLESNSSIFKERYAPVIGTDVPMVLFMRSDGGLIHSATGATMPKQASILFADLKSNYRLAQSAKPAEQVTEQYSETSNPPCVGPNCPLPTRTPDAYPVVDNPNRLIDLGKIRIRERVFDQVDSMADRATYQIAGAILVGFLVLLVGLGLLLILLRR